MRSFLSGLGIALALVGATFHAHGQRMTEQFIPIGQSPGVSGKYYGWIGVIADVDPAARAVTIAEPAGARTVRISEKTHIWLDRTKLKQSNVTGTFADLQKGRRAEVKYADTDRQVAEWVKVEIIQP